MIKSYSNSLTLVKGKSVSVLRRKIAVTVKAWRTWHSIWIGVIRGVGLTTIR